MEYRKISIEDKELQTRSVKNESGKNEIIGYASLVEHRSKPITELISINGLPPKQETYIETIKRGAFDETIFEDVIYTIDHDPSKLIARSSAGNLHLSVTDKGLSFTANPPDTTIARDLAANIEAGNYTENSFAFKVRDDSWSRVDGVLHRSINKIERVADVSTVLAGAYSNTIVTTRSLSMPEEVKEIEHDSKTIDLDFEISRFKSKV